MNWTMPYPWRSRRDSVRRINMSSEPGNESFFCALRPIPRILSLCDEITRVKFRLSSPPRARRFGVLTRAGCESLRRALPPSTTGYVRNQAISARQSLHEHTEELISRRRSEKAGDNIRTWLRVYEQKSRISPLCWRKVSFRASKKSL